MRSCNRESGFSRIEVICICGIAAAAVAVLLGIGSSALHDWREGNDSVTLNTALSCGNAELSGACLVPGCKGDKAPGHSSHVDANGNGYAYFDKVGNCLTGVCPHGYNEAEVTTRDGRSYAPQSAVVVVTDVGGAVSVDWHQGE